MSSHRKKQYKRTVDHKDEKYRGIGRKTNQRNPSALFHWSQADFSSFLQLKIFFLTAPATVSVLFDVEEILLGFKIRFTVNLGETFDLQRPSSVLFSFWPCLWYVSRQFL
jgi:hypothetical protein